MFVYIYIYICIYVYIYIFDPLLPKININCCFCWAFLFTAFCNAKYHGGKKCVCTHLHLSSCPIHRWMIYLYVCTYIYTYIRIDLESNQPSSLSHYCIQSWQLIFFPASFFNGCFTVCVFLFYSRMNQLCLYMDLLPFGLPFHSGHDSALSRVPFAIWCDLIVCVCTRMQLLSHVQLFVTPWTVARQAPLSMECSKQESWSGLPFPTPGDLPDPGIKLESLCFFCVGRWVLYHCTTWEVLISYLFYI